MTTISHGLHFDTKRLQQLFAASAYPLPVQDIRERISRLERIPPLPAITQEVLTLYTNPHASTEALARILEKDPALSLQVVRWANSAMYGRGESTTVKDAITRVLGFDLVMNLAVGLTAAAPLKVEQAGPLGLKAYWVDALCCAMLCQRLAKHCKAPNPPQPGVAYMAGLLHNLGLLLFGHLFPDEHKALNRILASVPDIPFQQLVKCSLGVTPATLSRWLLDDWKLPEILRVAISYQDDPVYHGIHSGYPRLVRVAKMALRPYQLSGYGASDLAADEPLTLLGLDSARVAEEVYDLLECKGEVVQFAGQMYH